MEIQPGIKIQCNQRTGTLGIIVSKENNDSKLYLLSCWHILDDGIETGDVVLPDMKGASILQMKHWMQALLKSILTSISPSIIEYQAPIVL